LPSPRSDEFVGTRSDELDDLDDTGDVLDTNTVVPARQILSWIIDEQRLIPGDKPMSDARFGRSGVSMSNQRRYFTAISFTETPLAELNSLLEIAYREINLEPYGLVFPKEQLCLSGVTPAWYVNNDTGDKLDVLRALCSLIDAHADEAAQILPLVAVFGKRLFTARARKPQRVDFSWEREWRWPSARGPFKFSRDDVYLGLCPHPEKPVFERRFAPIRFIDPRRPLDEYEAELTESSQRLGLEHTIL
jgi:hypothetical protein